MEDDEDRDEVATEMRNQCSARTESATRKHHQSKHQCVRGRMPALPRGVDEEIVIQVDCCIRKTRRQDDLITTRLGVDDSFGSCETTCVEYKGTRDVLGVKAIAILARSLSQPRLIIRNDGEHLAVEVVRQTCDELQMKMKPVTPTVSKGSNCRLEQANRATEGMTRRSCRVWKQGTKWKYRPVNQLCKGRTDTRFGCGNVSNQARIA